MNFSRKYIDSLEPKVKKVDSDERVDLFCYTTCDKNDEKNIQACRGLVYEKDDLVLKAFSYTPDYTMVDIVELEEKYPNLSEYKFFESYEGTLIRVFYHHKWYISTHRRLDAFKSKWSSKTSFGDLFVDALEYENTLSEKTIPTSETSVLEGFLSTLNKEYQYMFLLQNNKENRIVCNAPENPRLYHVGTFTKLNNDFVIDFEHSIGLSYPKSVQISSWSDVKDYVDNKVDYTTFQGLIMYNGAEQIKILNNDYKYFYDLRGNEASVKSRYLQVRMNDEVRKDYVYLYKEYEKEFDTYERVIHEIGRLIFTAYINRFIHKQHVVLHPEEYNVLKECHAWHISNRSKNRVSLTKVLQVLNYQDSPRMNKMIRRYLLTNKNN